MKIESIVRYTKMYRMSTYFFNKYKLLLIRLINIPFNTGNKQAKNTKQNTQ